MAFRQLFCAQCGYSLRGLPNSGLCPECGESYTPDEPVVFGVRGTERPGKRAYGCSIAVAIYFAMTSIGMLVSEIYVGFALYLFLIVFLLSWYPWQRILARRNRHRPEMQLRLTPIGYASRRGFGKVHFLRWRPDMEVSFVSEGKRQHRLQMMRLTATGVVDWSTVVHIRFHASPARAAFLRDYIAQCRAEAAAQEK